MTLSDVPVAAPRTGVVNVGDVAKATLPDPVTPAASAVATPVPRPETPVEIGRPVQLVSVPDVGVPSNGVTSVGDVAKTAEPEPVSSVNAAARLALVGVARNVATPVPSPLTPVDIGNPVQFVSTPADGVPRLGVVSVGDVASTIPPEPVTA